MVELRPDTYILPKARAPGLPKSWGSMTAGPTGSSWGRSRGSSMTSARSEPAGFSEVIEREEKYVI